MAKDNLYKDPNLRVLEAIRDINGADDQHVIMDVFTKFAAHYGFEKILIGQLVNPYNVPAKDRMILTDWPDDLTAHRIETGAVLHDPIAICTLRTNRPFQWAQAHKYASKMGRKIIDEARDYRIRDGIMVPVHALDSVSGGVSLGTEKLTVSKSDVDDIELVSRHVYIKLESLLGPFPYQVVAELTDREVEVVQLVAAGKTSWDIATILGVKEDTINKTMKRAADKLNAVNRAHAVATAIGQKLIFP